MVTLLEPWSNGQKRYAGLSTDVRPLDAKNGDLFIEMDTGTSYLYSQEDDTWYEVSSGGGGGSTDNKVGSAIVGTAKAG